jgi:thioredoxin 1
MAVKELSSKAEFHILVISTPFVILEVHAAWNGPSKDIEPIFTRLAETHAIPEKFVFAKLDADVDSDLTNALGVQGLPAFFLFEYGEKVHSLFGANPRALQEAVGVHSSKAKA